MAQEIVMPKLGDTMEEGTIVKWLAKEGDAVSKGAVIMEVETDKSVLEVESLVAGELLKIVVAEGRSVPIGTVLAYVGQKGDKLPDENMASPAPETKSEPVDAHGKGGPAGVIPFNTLRRITAEKMVLSRATIPCFDLTIEVQMDHALQLRSGLNASGTQRIAIHDLLILATARALREYPVMTGRWTEQGIAIPDTFGIGLAIGSEDGLVAPVLHNVNGMALGEIAEETRRLMAKAKAGKLEPEELTGACTTVSNLGMLGITRFTPIVIPGQSSIIGVGQCREVVVAKDGKPAIASVMDLTLSVDHRVTDGNCAARFLGAIKNHIEQPEQMIE